MTCDNRLIRCPHEAPNCIKGCKRKAHPGNGHYCENCRPLKCTKRINNKRPASEVALFPRPMKPSRMCHWAPTCTRPANASDNLGRCTTCMLYTNPPCKNHLLCKQRITTEASSGLCKECYKYGSPSHGSQGEGCPYVKRAKNQQRRTVLQMPSSCMPRFIGNALPVWFLVAEQFWKTLQTLSERSLRAPEKYMSPKT